MRQNGGLGKVMYKNRLLATGQFRDALTAVKHGNGRDWWIVVPENNQQVYTKFLLTPTGIEGPFPQKVSEMEPYFFDQAAFSPDGTQYARVTGIPNKMLIILAKFDRCTGKLCCLRYIRPIRPESSGLTGLSFSPNSRYLYFNSPTELYQYDTYQSNPPDIEEHPLLIDEFDGFSGPFATNFFRQQLAPDGRIYISPTNSVYYMHVIIKPNEGGKGCDFRQRYVKHSSVFPPAGLPNLPTFRLYNLQNSPCDTLPARFSDTLSVSRWRPLEDTLRVIPNPVSQEAYLTVGICRDGLLRVFNATGQMVFEQRNILGPMGVPIDVQNWPAGTYFVYFWADRKATLTAKMVVVH